jgi:hypothetical protein
MIDLSPSANVCDVSGCRRSAAFTHVEQGQINEEEKLCTSCYQDRILTHPELAARYRETEHVTGRQLGVRRVLSN